MLARLLVATFALVAVPSAVPAFSEDAADDGSGAASGQAPPVMTIDRLDAVIRSVDAAAARRGPGWQLSVDGTSVEVIADADHDRMRIVVPVAKAEDVSVAMLRRCMQANFSTALDARYAVARGVLWSTFLHPLGSLDEALFLSALGQTVTLARSYGTTFRSGVLSFGGEEPDGQEPSGRGSREPDLPPR